MSSDAFKERQKAAEEQFFQKQNEEALKRLHERKSQTRLSPVSGEPMEQLTIMGVVVDRCPKSGGVWLDAGELEQIIREAKGDKSTDGSGFVGQFFSNLFGSGK